MHTANSPSVVAPVDGIYLITGSVVFQGGTGGLRELQLSVNNTKPIADTRTTHGRARSTCKMSRPSIG